MTAVEAIRKDLETLLVDCGRVAKENAALIESIAGQRNKAESERDDARSLVAEVAQGVTHWAGCTPELRCVRCQRDEAVAALREITHLYHGCEISGEPPHPDDGEWARAIASARKVIKGIRP